MQQIIPDVVNNQTMRALGPADFAIQAGALMSEYDISAVVVQDAEQTLLGIVTERDLSRRIVAAGRNAADTPVSEIMTPEPAVLAPADSPYDALQSMRRLKVRHLPVVADGHVVGMVSIRDLRHAINHDLKPAHSGIGGVLHRLLNRLGL